MNPLKVLRLDPWAILPICAHPGEDLAFDLFSVEEIYLEFGEIHKVRTGVALEMEGYGFLMRDRSSLAAKAVVLFGGVIDAGYRGEILANMSCLNEDGYCIHPGDKIAQILPVKPQTSGEVVEVKRLTPTIRGVKGYGSSGV